jgi:hypothetical protein
VIEVVLPGGNGQGKIEMVLKVMHFVTLRGR